MTPEPTSETVQKEAFASFGEFWPFYLSEHQNPLNRRLHAIGTSLGVCIALAAVGSGTWALLLVAPIAGYGFAWVGHFRVERNKPASFKHPFWSFLGDFKMLSLIFTGRIDRELERLGIG